MDGDDRELQLKFAGAPVDKIGGAPADAVVNALSALQRIVHLIGMQAEKRPFGQRAKPSAKVRQAYAVICKAPTTGSHVQPFEVASYEGAKTHEALLAQASLLDILSAFSSGDASAVERTIPNYRERVFIADAASGLLPPNESGIQVTVRRGNHGPFAFRAETARPLIQRYREAAAPEAEAQRIAGRVIAVDFERYFISVRPSGGGKVFRFDYPVALESFVQSNRRRRISIIGKPTRSSTGDVSGFERVDTLNELEAAMPDIESFEAGNKMIVADPPLRFRASYNFEDKLFLFNDKQTGIDTFSESYGDLREATLEELAVLWQNYALAPDEELDDEAINLNGESRLGL